MFDTPPDRMFITELRTGDTLKAQFNPDEVKEHLPTMFNRPDVLGLSHQPQQYKNTGNYTVTFELGFDALSAGGNDASWARRKLISFAYARKGDADVGPAQLLLVWPNLLSITCYLTDIAITHKRFSRYLEPTLFSAACTFEQVSDTRIFADDVISQRGPFGGRG